MAKNDFTGIMDFECVSLCMKMNELSGVETTESCCGHYKDTYKIFFDCDDFISLAILTRCVDKRYSDGKWEIVCSNSDTHPLYGFLLRSKCVFRSLDELNESLKGLMENIDHWSDEKFKMYFKSNGKKTLQTQ
jgi:hypothetical protein